MQNAALSVATLAAQIELAILLSIKIYAPVEQFFNGGGGFLHDGANGCFIAEACTGIQSVGHVLFEGVILVNHRGNATLCLGRARYQGITLAEDGHLAIFGGAQGKTQSRHTAADY